VERVRRYQEPLCLVLLDIDHFKAINDTYGHPAGDEVIRSLGQACRQVVRAADMAGRLGGEEFALLLPHTSLEAAREVAERLRLLVAGTEVTTRAGSIAFRISLGVAERRPEEDVDALYIRADEALYTAKREGRDRTVLAG
jgi:diguanylate cyclase (GGDEF)-like protein